MFLPVSLSYISTSLCTMDAGVSMSKCATACTWRSEDSLQEFSPANTWALEIELMSSGLAAGPLATEPSHWLHEPSSLIVQLCCFFQAAKSLRFKSEHMPISTAKEEPCRSKAFSKGHTLRQAMPWVTSTRKPITSETSCSRHTHNSACTRMEETSRWHWVLPSPRAPIKWHHAVVHDPVSYGQRKEQRLSSRCHAMVDPRYCASAKFLRQTLPYRLVLERYGGGNTDAAW